MRGALATTPCLFLSRCPRSMFGVISRLVSRKPIAGSLDAMVLVAGSSVVRGPTDLLVVSFDIGSLTGKPFQQTAARVRQAQSISAIVVESDAEILIAKSSALQAAVDTERILSLIERLTLAQVVDCWPLTQVFAGVCGAHRAVVQKHTPLCALLVSVYPPRLARPFRGDRNPVCEICGGSVRDMERLPSRGSARRDRARY